jgi:hypothetical protein
MTRIEFDALRLRYEAASDAYHRHVRNVIEHTKGGQRPPLAALKAEAQALHELTGVRRELLDALAALH